MSRFKLGGVIVLYNPSSIKELNENITTYIDNLDILFLVDNSDKKIDISAILHISEKIQYFSMSGNKGLARALNQGCELAINHNCDYILLMDQDSFFKVGSFVKMVNSIKDTVALYAPNICTIMRDTYGKRILNEKLQYTTEDKEIHFAITSGSLINAEVYKQSGGFDNILFIAQIDQDYCCKIRHMGKTILRLGDVVLYQEFGRSRIKTILWRRVFLFENSPIRYYYVARNEIYLRSKWGAAYQEYRINFIKYTIAVFLQTNSFKKFTMLIQGVFDGFKMRRHN